MHQERITRDTTNALHRLEVFGNWPLRRLKLLAMAVEARAFSAKDVIYLQVSNPNRFR